MTVTDKNVKVEINYINDKVMKIHDDPDMPVCQARMGKPAPNFKAITTSGVIDFHAWLGDSWGILFSHPAPFTPICTTEMGSLARHTEQFKSRNVKLCGVSCENVKSLESWIVDIRAFYGLKDFDICLLADEDRQVARMYGLIEPTYRDNMYGIPYPCRGLFIVDPRKTVRMMSFHPWSVGRSTNELIRTLDSLQLTDAFENKVCTPADWEQNSVAMVDSSVNKDDINNLFRTGIVTYILPSGKTYMRTMGGASVGAPTHITITQTSHSPTPMVHPLLPQSKSVSNTSSSKEETTIVSPPTTCESKATNNSNETISIESKKPKKNSKRIKKSEQ